MNSTTLLLHVKEEEKKIDVTLQYYYSKSQSEYTKSLIARGEQIGRLRETEAISLFAIPIDQRQNVGTFGC